MTELNNRNQGNSPENSNGKKGRTWLNLSELDPADLNLVRDAITDDKMRPLANTLLGVRITQKKQRIEGGD